MGFGSGSGQGKGQGLATGCFSCCCVTGSMIVGIPFILSGVALFVLETYIEEYVNT